MATGADDETTDTSSDEPMDEKSKISFMSEREELVQVMEVSSDMDKFHLSSGSGEEEITSKGTCDEKGIKLHKAAGNGRSRKAKKAKSDPQAEIEELKREKRKLEEERKKLGEKVDNLEAKLHRIEAEREEGSNEKEQLRWNYEKLTDEISKSAIFTNRVHYLRYSDSRSFGVIRHLEKHPAAKPVATRSSGGPAKANGVLHSANRNTCGNKRKKGSCRWRIDLGKNFFLLITHCSLHQNPQDPRRGKWELNGSIDGKEWKVLERKQLEIDDRCTTWSVQNETTAFRYFKILQKGAYQAGKVRYGIFRSRVELYGALVEVKHVEEILGRSLEESKSKPLRSLLQHENSLQMVCEALDTPVPGCGNYRQIAQHYRFDYYKIESTLKSYNGGPSRALIEFLAATEPELTVQEFAVVIEERTKRKDVSQLLRKYDTAREGSV